MSDLKRQMQIFVNGVWEDAHHTTANEFPEDCVRFAEPTRPEMPEPKKTYADHSYPAYSREQMVQAMLDAVELYRRTQPETVDGDPIGDLQAESRQAKLDDFIASMKTQPEATAPAQDMGAAILRLQKANAALKAQTKLPAMAEAIELQAASKALLAAALASSANALGAGDRVDAEPIGYVNGEFLGARRAEFERNGMTVFPTSAGMATLPVFVGSAHASRDRLDAERYRWLRNMAHPSMPYPRDLIWVTDALGLLVEEMELDGLIDKAITDDRAILQSQKAK